MGIFDGILICSDWDGTLFDGETVPKISQDAIEYFKSEGGAFSISSGRGNDFILEHINLVRPNTYCICFGGSLICNVETGEIIRSGSVDYDAYDVVDTLIDSEANTKRINVYVEDGILHYSKEEFLAKRAFLPKPVYKITVNGETAADGEIYTRCIPKIGSEKYTLARSFASYIEIMKTKYTKGFSAKFLKNYIGARILVGMGDYENDVPLFKECDVSFAVGNAIGELKSIASYVTRKNVQEGAVCDVIETLKSEIEKGNI